MNDAYFEYLCDLALGKDVIYYSKLCEILHNRDFEYILDMDENRAIDGIELRTDYFNSHRIKWQVDLYYNDKPCSILEMMVALSQRCCDSIMDDGSGMDYTGELFRLMIQNLGLSTIPNTNFNLGTINDILDDFLDRKYSPDGRGSLFYIPDCTEDLRNIEIWSQAMWYLEAILN